MADVPDGRCRPDDGPDQRILQVFPGKNSTGHRSLPE
jgi:hypothetical protein